MGQALGCFSTALPLPRTTATRSWFSPRCWTLSRGRFGAKHGIWVWTVRPPLRRPCRCANGPWALGLLSLLPRCEFGVKGLLFLLGCPAVAAYLLGSAALQVGCHLPQLLGREREEIGSASCRE